MYLCSKELPPHLYPESIAAISDGDNRQLIAAISAAVVQAKGYLHKYDIEKIFEAKGSRRDQFLILIIKDIAVWHYINIANPNIDFSIREKRYDDAISWLKGVQRGDIIPDFPLPSDDQGNDQNTTGFLIGSNPKRGNYII